MIESHLQKINEQCNLTPQQLIIVRNEIVIYTSDALMDSKVATEAWNLCKTIYETKENNEQ